MKTYLVSSKGGGCLKYRLLNVESLTYNGSTSPIVLTMPEMEEPLVFNFQGRKNDVVVSWKIIESNEDLSDGTNKDASGNVIPIKTIQDQIDYLSQNFMTADVSTAVGVVVLKDDNTEFLKICGIPSKFSWRWNGGEMSISASLSLIESMASEVSCEW